MLCTQPWGQDWTLETPAMLGGEGDLCGLGRGERVYVRDASNSGTKFLKTDLHQVLSRIPPLLLLKEKYYGWQYTHKTFNYAAAINLALFLLFSPSRRSRGSDVIQSPSESSVPPPPELPPNTKAPWITIPTSTFPQDWSKLVNSDSHADVLFHLGSEHYHAHRLGRVRSHAFASHLITEIFINRKYSPFL